MFGCPAGDCKFGVARRVSAARPVPILERHLARGPNDDGPERLAASVDSLGSKFDITVQVREVVVFDGHPLHSVSRIRVAVLQQLVVGGPHAEDGDLGLHDQPPRSAISVIVGETRFNKHADGSDVSIALETNDVQCHPIASGALAPSADDHPARDRPYRLVVLICAVRRITKVFETGFKDVKQPRMTRFDILDRFEEQVLGRNLASAGLYGIIYRRVSSRLTNQREGRLKAAWW